MRYICYVGWDAQGYSAHEPVFGWGLSCAECVSPRFLGGVTGVCIFQDADFQGVDFNDGEDMIDTLATNALTRVLNQRYAPESCFVQI